MRGLSTRLPPERSATLHLLGAWRVPSPDAHEDVRIDLSPQAAASGERLGRGGHVVCLNLTGTCTEDPRETYRPCARFAGCSCPDVRQPNRLISRIICSSLAR